MSCRAVAFLLLLTLFSPSTLRAQQQTMPSLREETGYLRGADGVRLFYRRIGTGHDFVIFLHGGPGLSMQDGGNFMEPLGATHTLIMYDQRGGGRSDLIKDPAQLTADADVRDLEAVRSHFRVPKMALVGLSWGSGLAALYAAMHPDRVSRIVFLDPMPIAEKPFVEERNQKIHSLINPKDAQRLTQLNKQEETANDQQLIALCRQEMPLQFKAYFADPDTARTEKWDLCNVPAAALRNSGVVSQAVVASLGHFDLRPTLRKLNFPVLVIEGEKTNVPLDSTREWALNSAQGKLLLIANAGHATFVERTDDVLHAIQTFLSGHWPSDAKKVSP